MSVLFNTSLSLNSSLPSSRIVRILKICFSISVFLADNLKYTIPPSVRACTCLIVVRVMVRLVFVRKYLYGVHAALRKYPQRFYFFRWLWQHGIDFTIMQT